MATSGVKDLQASLLCTMQSMSHSTTQIRPIQAPVSFSCPAIYRYTKITIYKTRHETTLKVWEVNAEGSLGNCIHNYHFILWFTNTKFVTLLSLFGKKRPKTVLSLEPSLVFLLPLTFADRPVSATRSVPALMYICECAHAISFQSRSVRLWFCH